MDYFATPKNPKSDDLEVTGISRSGRVRKKSSKLLDFESPDDVTEQRLKRQRAQQHLHAQQILEKYEQSQKLKQQNANSPLQNYSIQQNNTPRQQNNTPRQINNTPRQINNVQQRNNTQQQIQIKQEIKDEDTQESSEDEEESSESEPEATNGIHHEGSSEESSSGDDDDDEEDDDEDESEEDEVEPMEVTGFTKLEPPEQTELPSQAKNSLYMLEKYKKKLVIKDGKVISRTTKSQRKDKGVTRFTAYMLWSKEARQQLVEHHPNLDFATISKKLGELWATVPNLEKHNWKKRAKRLQMRSGNPNKLSQSSRQFINKTGTVANRVTNSVPKTINLGAPTIGNKLFVSPPHQNKSGKDLNDAYLSAGGYKVTGTQPIDVAAHLALLDRNEQTSLVNYNKANTETRKPRRKNKEATRVTSFSLWSREQRKELLERNPHLDFPTVARVLGELWAAVPTPEKLDWQKCAENLRISTGLQSPYRLSKRKDRNQNPAKKRKRLNVPPPCGSNLAENRTLAHDNETQPVEVTQSDYVPHLGTQPIDVAAHLALLGESLILIGKKLKENEGRISVSGSLPLLLNSLLCALGPLLCLTQLLPEMNGANPEVLSSTLDNIKYIMPAPALMLQTLRKESA